MRNTEIRTTALTSATGCTWKRQICMATRGCKSYIIAVQADVCRPHTFTFSSTQQMFSLTVWPRQRTHLPVPRVPWQPEQDDNGHPRTLCTKGQECDGLQLRHILILIHIKAVCLAQSHQLQTHGDTHRSTRCRRVRTLSKASLHACANTHI